MCLGEEGEVSGAGQMVCWEPTTIVRYKGNILTSV
jgi:hypothetical protein